MRLPVILGDVYHQLSSREISKLKPGNTPRIVWLYSVSVACPRRVGAGKVAKE
jgi:hypothetical protein